MKVSVIICTLNRHRILESAILSMEKQTLKKDLFELIVVDNGSVDQTKKMVESLMGTIPNMRYVFESNKGLSNARNHGIRESSGDIVAFLDDDAIADSQWLEHLYSVYQIDSEVGAVGGKINVLWDHDRPSWVNDLFESYFGKFDLGEKRKQMIYPEYPYGSNMSILRELIVEIGGFRTELGRKGKSLVAAEETDLFYRINSKKIRVIYEPKAIVYHRVLTERLSKTWGLRRSFSHGESMAILNSFYHARTMREKVAEALETIPMVLAKLVLLVKYGFSRRGGTKSFYQMMGLAYWLGMLFGKVKTCGDRR